MSLISFDKTPNAKKSVENLKYYMLHNFTFNDILKVHNYLLLLRRLLYAKSTPIKEVNYCCTIVALGRRIYRLFISVFGNF